MDVAIRELKSKLSHFLDRAAKGEIITVTDRGRPKAILGPLPAAARIDEGIAEGWISPGDKRGRVTHRVRARSDKRTDSVIDEDRGA